MSSAVYEKLSGISVKRLDKLEYEHGQHLETFTQAKNRKMKEIRTLEARYEKYKDQARRELKKSKFTPLGTTMDMRYVKADIIVSKSIVTVLRSNQFFHRLMVVLIQDVKAGVEYDPEKLRDLIPLEFSEMVSDSIMATNVENLLHDLSTELREVVEHVEQRLVLKPDDNGCFYVNGSINNIGNLRFLVDTGATNCSVPEKLGVIDTVKTFNLEVGETVETSTAAGPGMGYRTTLPDVTIGQMSIKNVDALINPLKTGDSEFCVLGMTFLEHIDWRHKDGMLILNPDDTHVGGDSK